MELCQEADREFFKNIVTVQVILYRTDAEEQRRHRNKVTIQPLINTD
ncbi:MAG: hypothetical protein AB1422_08475 [bacterium]